ncbi:sensor histidine kinase [Microbacterium sp. M3]|uniref:Oxygen sensor histidine kinase NreB n=1 Tax=Microbacterium arthrosphaerae TaxID=792652 RepID=A0ABU4GZ22_9MICO|nr:MULTISPECIES: sensor histidine kinase [Microbacterium]MDW4571709.1 sensor histidine kinase [Microbacterium arthrosphaerae]MDW7605564.1 sensor histidine kinase [Microbacterium sp. M3]
MLKPRWWDVTVGAGSLAIAVGLIFGFGPDDPGRVLVGLASIALFALTYVLIARPALADPPAGWRFPAFLVVAALSVGVGAAAAPFLAMLQTLAYPLTWVLGDTRKRGILGSVVIAVSVFTGVFLGSGLTADAAVSGAATAIFSVVFATALGLWIASIAEYGEERARLVGELTAAQAQVEALSRDRGAAQERERLARDIHDTLAQTLAGLVIFAERAGRQSREGRADAAAETIATVEQVARDALAEARALVARTAAVPSEPVLTAAVERLVDRFRAHGIATVTLDADVAQSAVDRDTEVVLLRCLQEGLSNAAKHAGAAHVTVHVGVAPDGTALLVVSDDGAGFDPSEPTRGFGLSGMRERVEIAGGTLEVSSRPHAGTTLRVSLPAAHVTEGEHA